MKDIAHGILFEATLVLITLLVRTLDLTIIHYRTFLDFISGVTVLKLMKCKL